MFSNTSSKIDSNIFLFFLKRIVKNNQRKLIIVDNAKIHKTEKIKELIRLSNNEILYTVPYSPRLNAIEHFFSQFKHYIKLKKPKYMNLVKTID